MSLLAKLKKTDKSLPDVIQRSVDFEITREHLMRLSERRAWIVSACSVTLALVLAAGYFFVMPLKEKIPYLVTVDPYTGTSAVAKLVGDFNNMSITANEAVNKANISNFITAYEAYDWDLWTTRDALVVYSMATGEVLKAFESLYANKTLSPNIVLGRKKRQFVRIKSLVLTEKDNRGFPVGATARFERFVIDKAAEAPMSAESFIVTLTFEYKSNLQMQEEMRIQNPLGFRVTAYRVDPDNSASQSRDLIMRELSNTAAGQPLLAPEDATPLPKK
jgi:type IV secretion system protein VirB8